MSSASDPLSERWCSRAVARAAAAAEGESGCDAKATEARSRS